ncbi:LysM peptidoglycan-binding domain-containing protein, partial [Ilumatobacter sp.]|uniref:LysM peptidoglycan-binding domain-containing protein n=1 Tax=Ilumatobacter sp. TaxID=1967498 RepID=UPI003AF82622
MAAPEAPPTSIMRPTDHDPRSPFDHEFDGGSDDADVTQEFWGTSRDWDDRGAGETRRTLPDARGADDTTGAIRAIRNGVAAFRPQRMDIRDSTGQVRRTREHGTVRQPAAPGRADRRAAASIGDLAAGRFDEPFEEPVDERPADAWFGEFDPRDDAEFPGPPDIDDRDLVPLSAVKPEPARLGLGAVDPLLVRFGALALVGVLLVPVALAARSSDPATDSVLIESPAPAEAVIESHGAPAAAGADGTTAPTSEATSPGAEPAAASDVSGDAPVEPPSGTAGSAQAGGSATGSTDDGASSNDGAQAESEAIGDSGQASQGSSDGAIDDAATVDEPAERVVPECPQTYTAGAGDSWFGIADAAGVSPGAVMAENLATGDTVILPGDEICLPADATIPATPAP